MRRVREGFTLLELLVVIGVAAVLLGLLLPAVQSSREAASRAACQSGMRQIGLALHGYHGSHGRFPSSGGGYPRGYVVGTILPPEALLSWQANILPFIEQEELWRRSVAACGVEPLPFRSPPHVGWSIVVRVYVCPADESSLTARPLPQLVYPNHVPDPTPVGMTSYIGNTGTYRGAKFVPSGPSSFEWVWNGVLRGTRSASLAEITDGSSQTIVVGERPPPDTLQAGSWYQNVFMNATFGGPNGLLADNSGPGIVGDPCAGGPFGPGRRNNPCDRLHYWSLHRGGANFLLADGAVRFVRHEASELMPAYLTRDGGEAFPIP